MRKTDVISARTVVVGPVRPRSDLLRTERPQPLVLKLDGGMGGKLRMQVPLVEGVDFYVAVGQASEEVAIVVA